MKFLVIERDSTTLHSEDTLRKYLADKPSNWVFRGPEGTIKGFPKQKVDYAVNLTETPLEKGTSVIIKIDGAVNVPVFSSAKSAWWLAGDATVRKATASDIGKKVIVSGKSGYQPGRGDINMLLSGSGCVLSAVTTDGKFAITDSDSLYKSALVLE